VAAVVPDLLDALDALGAAMQARAVELAAGLVVNAVR
jgi:hypothetical protein